MAPQEVTLPGTVAHRPHGYERTTVDKRILAQGAQHSPTGQEQKVREERNCFYCLEGWVFLGSLDHDGQEVYECGRCKRCDGPGVLKLG
jgi:predicted SprT family Zn-dependent metalloprotease